jgi:hypothetical protein
VLPSCNVSASMFAWRRRQSVSLNRRMEGLLSTRNGSRTTRPSFRVARYSTEEGWALKSTGWRQTSREFQRVVTLVEH